jgi:hypothetical protein
MWIICPSGSATRQTDTLAPTPPWTARRRRRRCRLLPLASQVHHQGHHQTYTDKLNQSLETLKGLKCVPARIVLDVL